MNLTIGAKLLSLRTLKESGMSNEQIEARLMEIDQSYEIKRQLIAAYVQDLPQKDRLGAIQRILPDFFTEPNLLIRVYTVEGGPTFNVSAHLSPSVINDIVGMLFADQLEGHTYSWTSH